MVTLTSMKVFTAVVEAEEGAVNLNSSPRGTLRLTMPMSFGILHMGPMISAYFKQYPEVKIDIQLTDRRVDLIEEGLDFAVRIGALAESGLIAKKLASDSLVVCGSPDYFERHGVRLRAPALVASGRTLNFLAGRTVSSHGRVQERTARPAMQSLSNGNARPRSWRCLVKETTGINAIRRVAILASKQSHAAIEREIRLTAIERHISVASAVKRIPFARTRHVTLGLGASNRHQHYRSHHEPIQHK